MPLCTLCLISQSILINPNFVPSTKCRGLVYTWHDTACKSSQKTAKTDNIPIETYSIFITDQPKQMYNILIERGKVPKEMETQKPSINPIGEKSTLLQYLITCNILREMEKIL